MAGGYIYLRDLDRQLEIAKATARSRGDSYKIFQDRYAGGVISLLELSQNKSQYEEALATIPQFEKSIAQQENALSVLLGRNPGPIARGKDIDTLTAPVAPAGLPSSLLERRPDIREAEQKLIAANAQIGAAKAAYYPSISLTGALWALPAATCPTCSVAHRRSGSTAARSACPSLPPGCWRGRFRWPNRCSSRPCSLIRRRSRTPSAVSTMR